MCWIKLFVVTRFLLIDRHYQDVKINDEIWINLAECLLVTPPSEASPVARIDVTATLAFTLDEESGKRLIRAVEIGAKMAEKMFEANERPPRKMQGIAVMPSDLRPTVESLKEKGIVKEGEKETQPYE